MSTKTQAPAVIELVRIKSWYIPKNAESYQGLKALGVPLLLIQKDFLPTLQLMTRRNNVRATETLWADVLNPLLDKVGMAWKAGDGRSCVMQSDKLTFLAKASAKNRAAVSKLECALAKFFARWSFRYYPTFSETGARYKLVVEFKFDPMLSPIVPSVVAEPKTEYELVLGFTKIKLTVYDKPHADLKAKALIAPLVVVEVFTKTGNSWCTVHTGTFTNSQIGDPKQFCAAMGLLYGRYENNT